MRSRWPKAVTFAISPRDGSRRLERLNSLAMGLYEVFADRKVETAALRHTIYRQWREKPAIRDRTIRLLACEDTSVG